LLVRTVGPRPHRDGAARARAAHAATS
jgi:hypothetical protein